MMGDHIAIAAGVLTIGFLISILCCHIQAARNGTIACPHHFSYILGNYCYSVHTEYRFNYKDAIDHCQKYNGTLWSKKNEEEVEFLIKVKAKQSFHYWVGAQLKGNNWEYLSDGSQVPNSLIKPKNKKERCLTVNQPENKLIQVSCFHNSHTICEYTGEICQVRKGEGKECYDITTYEEDFGSAKNRCKLLGGRIAEAKNELYELREILRKDNSFEKLTEDELKKREGSQFPTLWHLNDQLEDEKLCEIFENGTEKTINCTGDYYFVCKFEVIYPPPNTVAVHQPNSSRHTTPKLDKQEGIICINKIVKLLFNHCWFFGWGIFYSVSETPKTTTDTCEVCSTKTGLTVATVILAIFFVMAVACIIYLLRLQYRSLWPNLPNDVHVNNRGEQEQANNRGEQEIDTFL